MPGNWSLLQNLGPFTPDGGHVADAMILLTDASILIHDLVPGNGWWRLYPAADGFYDSGTWSGPFNMEYQRTDFASGIMMDGRLFVLGGEYSNDPNDILPAEGKYSPTWEIFDPTTNIWTPQPKPLQGTPNFNYIAGDASSCVLSDGRLLFGSFEDSRSAIFDPGNQNTATEGWAEAGLVLNSSGILVPSRSEDCNEETWTLLPDGSVITVCTFDYAPGTDRATLRYLPDSDQWVSAGQTPQEFPTGNQEMGPAILLPNGTLFAIGATGNTGIYTPPAVMSEAGTWSQGPPLTLNNVQQGCSDGPAVLMPSGIVLCVGGPFVGSGENLKTTPASFLEYDYTTNKVQPAPQPPASWGLSGVSTDTFRMLLLPTGQVMLTSVSALIGLYTPEDRAPQASWAPVITSAPSGCAAGAIFTISGRQLNGLSQAVSFGDDYQAATNYPIVRIQQGFTTLYGRTFNFSTLGVATGEQTVSAQVEAPVNDEGLSLGPAELSVIANGIPSASIEITYCPTSAKSQCESIIPALNELLDHAPQLTVDELTALGRQLELCCASSALTQAQCAGARSLLEEIYKRKSQGLPPPP